RWVPLEEILARGVGVVRIGWRHIRDSGCRRASQYTDRLRVLGGAVGRAVGSLEGLKRSRKTPGLRVASIRGIDKEKSGLRPAAVIPGDIQRPGDIDVGCPVKGIVLVIHPDGDRPGTARRVPSGRRPGDDAIARLGRRLAAAVPGGVPGRSPYGHPWRA